MKFPIGRPLDQTPRAVEWLVILRWFPLVTRESLEFFRPFTILVQVGSHPQGQLVVQVAGPRQVQGVVDYLGCYSVMFWVFTAGIHTLVGVNLELPKYTQFRLYGFSGYMDYILPRFRLYGLLKYGLFAYLNHFCRDKCGPYIRNWVYLATSNGLMCAFRRLKFFY